MQVASFPVSLFGDIVRGLISPNIENSPKGHKAFMPLASFRLSGFDEIGADWKIFQVRLARRAIAYF